MKKFLSTAAVLAVTGGFVLCSPLLSNAKVVSTKNDTAVSMYGFINYTMGLTNKMDANAGFTNMPKKDIQNIGTKFSSTSKMARLGLSISNKDACVSGKIEFDFASSNLTRLRRAFIKYGYNNFYILAGQEWGIEEVHTFSTNWKAIAGFNGNGNRYPQLRFATNFDFGGTKLDLMAALEDKDWTSFGSGVGFLKKTFPTFALKASANINTGFGKPARIYTFGTLTPIKISINGESKNKTPYVYGAGFLLPVSMVTLQAEYIYSKGATKFAGLSSKTPSSYYIDSGGKLRESKSSGWNIEAKIKPMSKMWIAGGYDYVKFKYTNYAKNPKVTTIFANIGYKTTKYTVVSLEWLHAEAKNFSDSKEKGNSVFVRYFYKF